MPAKQVPELKEFTDLQKLGARGTLKIAGTKKTGRLVKTP
jgi:hypothetical protein